MSTSGSYSWNLNRDQAILQAFQEINVYSTDDTINNISNGDQTLAQNKLNGMLKMWSIDGIKVTKRKRGFLFPALNQFSYVLGSISGSDNCTNTYASTTINSAALTNATVLTIVSNANMNNGDNIGIELDNGTRQWTTIVSSTSTTVTITTGLTSTAAIGNTIISYTTKINRPLEVLYGTTLDLKSQNNEVSIQAISHDQYWHMPIKSTTGRPNNLYYDKPLNGVVPHNSNLYLYPQPQNVYQIITFIYVDAIQDLVNATDDIDLPQEWEYPVIFNLACELAYSYGKFTELQQIQPKADKMYQLLKDASSDFETLIFKLGDAC